MNSDKSKGKKSKDGPAKIIEEETLETKIGQFDQFLQYLDKTYTAQNIEEIPVPRDAPGTKTVVKRQIQEPLDTSIDLSEVPDDEEIIEDLQEAATLDEIIDSSASETMEIEGSAYDVTQLIDTMEEPGEVVAKEEFVPEKITEEFKELLPEIVVTESNRSEEFAHNYLFARFPITYMLILVPQAIALLANIFIEPSKAVEDFDDTPIDELIKNNQFDIVDNYLIALKLTLTILLAFFLCYRWSTMQNDGSYGYWLTQGVNRRRFFLQTTYKFLFTIYFGSAIGLILVFYLNGINLGILMFFNLNILLISHLLVLVTAGIIIGNTVKNPESASLIFIVLFGANAVFNNNDGSILHKILQSDMQYRFDPFISLILSIGLSALITLVSLRIHLKLDLEL